MQWHGCGNIICKYKKSKAKKMKQILLLMFLALLPLQDASARQCPRCHGSGWQVTIPDVSHYGVEKNKKRCPVCGDMVFSGHRDQCTVCGGSGNIDDRVQSDGNSAAEAAADRGREFLMQNLTADEYSYLQSVLQSMFLAKTVWDDCNVCNGTGKCPQCGGYQNFSIDADVSTLCRLCGGAGLCIRCDGRGFLNKRIELMYSDAERQRMAANCGVINSLAQKRSAMGVSPDDPNGPCLDVDDDGMFYIRERASGDGQGYADSDGDGSYGDSYPSEYTSKRGNEVGVFVIIAGVVLLAIIVACIMKKKSSKKRLQE